MYRYLMLTPTIGPWFRVGPFGSIADERAWREPFRQGLARLNDELDLTDEAKILVHTFEERTRFQFGRGLRVKRDWTPEQVVNWLREEYHKALAVV